MQCFRIIAVTRRPFYVDITSYVYVCYRKVGNYCIYLFSVFVFVYQYEYLNHILKYTYLFLYVIINRWIYVK